MIFETVASGGCRSVCCEFGRISTLAAATLRIMGFQGAVALDGAM